MRFHRQMRTYLQNENNCSNIYFINSGNIHWKVVKVILENILKKKSKEANINLVKSVMRIIQLLASIWRWLVKFYSKKGRHVQPSASTQKDKKPIVNEITKSKQLLKSIWLFFFPLLREKIKKEVQESQQNNALLQCLVDK